MHRAKLRASGALWAIVTTCTLAVILSGCANDRTRSTVNESAEPPIPEALEPAAPPPTLPPEEVPPAKASNANTPVAKARANVVAVEASGDRFSVTIRSNETGCDQYANWWEVVRPDGTLIYRRILAHSHVDEQPFTRSGGPVDVADDATVIVRAHMHPSGYGGAVMRGSKAEGFVVDTSVTSGFAGGLATTPPLPTGCAF